MATFCSMQSVKLANAGLTVAKQICPLVNASCVYQTLSAGFSDQNELPPDLYRKHYAHCFKRDIEPSLVPKDYPRSGVDFPSWIEPTKSSCVVMVIGQDPMRNEDEFCGLDPELHVVIGTPYALHSHYRREVETNNYWKVLGSLVANGCTLYLTDIRKVWADKYKADKQIRNTYKNMLDCEIQTVSPDYILTFGKSALNFLSVKARKYNMTEIDVTDDWTYRYQTCVFPLIPLVHPSGRARNSHPKFIATNSKLIRKSTSCDALYQLGEIAIRVIF